MALVGGKIQIRTIYHLRNILWFYGNLDNILHNKKQANYSIINIYGK